MTQWRTSWLSREGVVAVLTYIPAGLLAFGWTFLETNSGIWALLGGLAAGAGGASIRLGSLRMLFWGATAMALTALVGHLFGVTAP